MDLEVKGSSPFSHPFQTRNSTTDFTDNTDQTKACGYRLKIVASAGGLPLNNGGTDFEPSMCDLSNPCASVKSVVNSTEFET